MSRQGPNEGQFRITVVTGESFKAASLGCFPYTTALYEAHTVQDMALKIGVPSSAGK